jgi:hypothetical protein
MKEELEEGDFDTDGYFHWKKNVNIVISPLMTHLHKGFSTRFAWL